MVGFVQDRIEIREGQTLPLKVRFDADTDLLAWLDELTIPLRVAVEDGTGSQDDVVVARQVGIYGLGVGRTAPVSDVTLLLLRAREDGLFEETETLRLRLFTETDPAEGLLYEHTARVAFRRAEIEVVILDGADRCSGVRLTAATPRRSRSGATCQQGINLPDGHQRGIGHGGFPASGPGPDVADPQHSHRTRRGRLPPPADRPVEAEPPRMGLPVPAVPRSGARPRSPLLECRLPALRRGRIAAAPRTARLRDFA